MKSFSRWRKSAGNNSTALKSLADAMSTHPPSEERVKQMNEMAAASPAVKGAVVRAPGLLQGKANRRGDAE